MRIFSKLLTRRRAVTRVKQRIFEEIIIGLIHEMMVAEDALLPGQAVAVGSQKLERREDFR